MSHTTTQQAGLKYPLEGDQEPAGGRMRPPWKETKNLMEEDQESWRETKNPLEGNRELPGGRLRSPVPQY